MALSGSFTGSTANQYITPKIVWSATQSVTANTSTVTAKLYYSKSSLSNTATGGYGAYKITIDGKSKSFDNVYVVLNPGGGDVLVGTFSVTISHNADGTKKPTISATGYITGTTMSSTSISKTVTLDTIPRTSSVTATDANIGGKTTISITRAASGFTHTLTYSFEGLTGTIATKTTETSIAWTVPTAFYAKIPNDPSGKCTITCTTYSGSTAIGTDTATFTATAAEATNKPSVSVAAVDTNSAVIALTGSNKRIVKGFSDVKVTTTAEPKNSAKISSVSVTCGVATKSGTSVTFDDAESATIKAVAKDSRGYSNSATASGLTLVNYIVPTIVETITRESPTSNVVKISAKGNWFNGNFGAKQNTLKVQVRYKPKSQSAYVDADKYVDMTVTTNGNTYTAEVTLSGMEYTNAYSIRIRASDAIHVYNGTIAEPVYKNTEIKKGVPVFDWGEEDFQFNVPVNMPKNLYQTSGGGFNMNNSDIVNFNALYGADEADDPKEGINFYRDGTNWDGLWAKRGNLFFCPNYPAETAAFSLFYAAGSKITLASQSASFSGFMTDSTKRLTFTIPLSKPVIASEVSLSGSVVGRGVGGYIAASSADAAKINLSGGDNYTVTVSKSDVGLNVRVEYAEAIPLATNNTTVAVTPYGTVEITFS